MAAADALAAFKAAMKQLPQTPSEAQWRRVVRLYGVLREALTPEQRKELWAHVKDAQRALRAGVAGAEADPYVVFDRFARLRTKRCQQSDRYREKRARYRCRPEVREREAARAATPERQEQIRRARARHKAKKKAERTRTRSAL